MKPQLPVIPVVPAALAAAAIVSALVLIPGGGASAPSSGLTPALKLVAGDVVAVVQGHAPTVGRARPQTVASPPAPVAAAREQTPPPSSPSHTRSVPKRPPVHRPSAARKPAVTRAPAAVPNVEPALKSDLRLKHGQGKAKAWGHLRKAKAWGHVRKAKAWGHVRKAKAGGHPPKIARLSASSSAVPQSARVKSERGQGHRSLVGLTRGPRAVPPGHEKGGKGVGRPGPSSSRGGGK